MLKYSAIVGMGLNSFIGSIIIGAISIQVSFIVSIPRSFKQNSQQEKVTNINKEKIKACSYMFSLCIHLFTLNFRVFLFVCLVVVAFLFLAELSSICTGAQFVNTISELGSDICFRGKKCEEYSPLLICYCSRYFVISSK